MNGRSRLSDLSKASLAAAANNESDGEHAGESEAHELSEGDSSESDSSQSDTSSASELDV